MSGHAEMVLGHDIEAVTYNGETFHIICSCMWETWRNQTEQQARDDFDDHVLDDVRTRLSTLHEARERVSLT